MRAKNPRTPPGPLTYEPGDIHALQTPLWRIHRVSGPHPSRWDDLRQYGPVSSMRWDPHPAPAGVHKGVGVSYASPYLDTAVAEAFQNERMVTLSGERALVGWVPVRPLRLLGVTGEWTIRNGASASLNSACRSTCREWARIIHQTWPELDGLLVTSTMTGKASVVLFTPAASSFPASPALSTTLDQQTAANLITPVASRFKWPLRRL